MPIFPHLSNQHSNACLFLTRRETLQTVFPQCNEEVSKYFLTTKASAAE